MKTQWWFPWLLLFVLIMGMVAGGSLGWASGKKDLASYHFQISELQNELDELKGKYEHDVWHLQQKQDQYYEARQGCFQELIDSGLYEVEFEISGEYGSLKSYKKVNE